MPSDADSIAERKGIFGRLFPPLKAETSELLHLDALRLIASLAIVVSHFKLEAYQWPGSARLFQNMQTMNVFVDVFFVISGIVIAYVYKQTIQTPGAFGQFLRKRFARLAPLHWATLAFYVALAIVGAKLGAAQAASQKYDWNCLLPNLLAVHSFGVCKALSFNNVSWSISAEMAMYVIFPLLIIAMSKAPRTAVLLCLAGVIGLTTFDYFYYGRLLWTERTYDYAPVRALPAFALGVAVFINKEVLIRFALPSWLAATTVLALLLGTFLGLSKLVLIPLAYASAILAFRCDITGQKPSRLVHVFALGGILTYSLYMLHPIVGVVLIKIGAERVLHLSGWPMNAWILLSTLAVFPPAYLSYVWFERPLRRALSGSRPARLAPTSSLNQQSSN